MSDAKPCCGNCKRFAFEDAYGFGWCLERDREMTCDQDACESYDPIELDAT